MYGSTPPPSGKSTTSPETTILLYSDWTKAVSPVRLRDFDKSNGGSRDQIVKSTKTRETWEQFEHAQTKVTFVWRKALGQHRPKPDESSICQRRLTKRMK